MITFAPLWTDSVAWQVKGVSYVLVETSVDLKKWRPGLNLVAKPTNWNSGQGLTLAPGETRFYRANTKTQSIARMNAPWNGMEIDAYQFRYDRVCWCQQPSVTITGRVTVRDGAVVKVENANIENPSLSLFTTIEETFAILVSEFETADIVGVDSMRPAAFHCWSEFRPLP